MTLDVPTIENGVWAVVKSFLGAELAEAAGPNERLVTDLGLDSLDVAEIVADVGERLHLDIDTGKAALSQITVGMLLQAAVDAAEAGRPAA